MIERRKKKKFSGVEHAKKRKGKKKGERLKGKAYKRVRTQVSSDSIMYDGEQGKQHSSKGRPFSQSLDRRHGADELCFGKGLQARLALMLAALRRVT